MSNIQRRPPPPPTKYRKSTQSSATTNSTSTTSPHDTDQSPTPPSYSSSTSHSHSNISLTSYNTNSTNNSPSKPITKSLIKMPPNRPPPNLNYSNHNHIKKIKRSHQSIDDTKTSPPIKNIIKPPPVPQHLLDKYKHKNIKSKSKPKEIHNSVPVPVFKNTNNKTHKNKNKNKKHKSKQKPAVSPKIKKIDSPRPKIKKSFKSGFTLDNNKQKNVSKIPDNKVIDKTTKLIQSSSSPTNDIKHHAKTIMKVKQSNSRKYQYKSKTPRRNIRNAHSRESSIAKYSNISSDSGNNIDAATFNSLLLTQDIETYRVIFSTRVCGIELIPFDSDGNLGAVVIKCHTDFSKKKVILQSLLININGEVCINRDYDQILQMISTCKRPLKLTFHPPSDDIFEYNINNNIQIDGGYDDEDDDGDYYADPLLNEDNYFIDPTQLFNKNNKGNNIQMIQKAYTMLYHKYIELISFQELTKNTVHDKMNEVKRLSKENMTLKTILARRESELQKITISQYSENKKLKEIMDKYEKLNEKNIEIEKINSEQKQKIEQLKYDLKQSKIFIREFKRRQKQNNKNNNNNGRIVNINRRQHKKSQSNNVNVKSINNSNGNEFQNELRNRLESIHTQQFNNNLQSPILNSRNKKKHFKSVNCIHRHKTPPPNLHRKIRPIPPIMNDTSFSLQTPLYNNDNNSKEFHRSKSTNNQKEKRQSAIGLLFKNFGKKNKYNKGRKRVNSKYHPQIEKIVKNKNNNKRKGKKNIKNKKDMDRNGMLNNDQRIRSNSLESNMGRARKETIV